MLNQPFLGEGLGGSLRLGEEEWALKGDILLAADRGLEGDDDTGDIYQQVLVIAINNNKQYLLKKTPPHSIDFEYLNIDPADYL